MQTLHGHIRIDSFAQSHFAADLACHSLAEPPGGESGSFELCRVHAVTHDCRSVRPETCVGDLQQLSDIQNTIFQIWDALARPAIAVPMLVLTVTTLPSAIAAAILPKLQVQREQYLARLGDGGLNWWNLDWGRK